METYLALTVAALAEIAGCFAFWTWLRQDESMLWLAPGMVAFGLSAYLPTLAESEAIGRAYAAYDGIYIAAAKPGDRGREPNIAGAGSSVWFRAAYRPG